MKRIRKGLRSKMDPDRQKADNPTDPPMSRAPRTEVRLMTTTTMRPITGPTTQVNPITATVKLKPSQQDAVDIVTEGAITLPRAFK